MLEPAIPRQQHVDVWYIFIHYFYYVLDVKLWNFDAAPPLNNRLPDLNHKAGYGPALYVRAWLHHFTSNQTRSDRSIRLKKFKQCKIGSMGVMEYFYIVWFFVSDLSIWAGEDLFLCRCCKNSSQHLCIPSYGDKLTIYRFFFPLVSRI